MEELTKLLSKVEFIADEIIDSKAQIVHLDARTHKNREALRKLGELQTIKRTTVGHLPTNKNWVCIGNMFIKLPAHRTRNLINDDQVEINSAINKLRDEQKKKVSELHELEGKKVSSGFNLKPLNKDEILSLKTAFKL